MKKINTIWKQAGKCLLLMTVLCGVLYPAAMSALALLIFPDQAGGSLLRVQTDDTETIVGSALLGQQWTQKKYLIGRDHTGAPSNLSPVSSQQKEAVEERISWWHAFDPETTGKQIPYDLLTLSASGADPHITPEAAMFQAERIAKERGITKEEVITVIQTYTEDKTFGALGEKRVNVFMVNLALDGYAVK